MFTIELTGYNCGTCGSNIVPYPLSLINGPVCGDPVYRNFACSSINQVFFASSAGVFHRVTYIDPQRNTFTIAMNGSICRGNNTDAIQKLLKLEHSSTFKVSSGCISEFNEVNIQWAKPFEPICNSPKDCTKWPNSSCNSSTDGKMRCLCNSSFNWTGNGCRSLPSKI